MPGDICKADQKGTQTMRENNNNNMPIESMAQLPLMALEEIPSPKHNAQNIVALQKSRGHITGYQLSSGSVVSKEEGVRLAKQREIAGVGIGVRNGTEYLKSLPDQSENNNLGNLPTIPNTNRDQ